MRPAARLLPFEHSERENRSGGGEARGPLALLTKTALAVGQSFTTANGVTVLVNSSVAFPAGGFSITVNDPNALAMVPDVFEENQLKASTIISEAGFIPKFSIPQKYANYPPSSLWVRSQSPVANTAAPLGSTVQMDLTGEKIL
jgi:hypothetical protein